MQCPKCHAQMQTYNRNGIQIEQCSGCRGIFLDYGELESLTRIEAQWTQQPPAPPAPQAYPAAPAPAWGAPQHHGGGHYGGHHRHKSFGHMLFSS
ncbi:zf-TFIIB domain-containing protein [Streptomyces sp. NPDC051664]|uniref:TFIIB-type zinc ribbon-containing protein n=1 Tax=Streptomyces sp. NPDC051664 TaxID=3365668 RepID=UPI0037B1FCCA